MVLLIGLLDMFKAVFEKYLAWANGWIDALLVAEIVERRATGRRKNDILIEQLRCFNGQCCRIWVRFNDYFLSSTSAACSL
jgi:hypothetical protein